MPAGAGRNVYVTLIEKCFKINGRSGQYPARITVRTFMPV